MLRTILAATALAFSVAALPARADTTLTVLYSAPDVWGNIHQQITKEFNAQHPDIKLTFLSSYKEYEDALQAILRGAITGQLPDVTFQGLNRIRVLSDRGLAVSLEPFIKAEADWDKMGYDSALLSLGQVQGKQVGLGWAISTPVIYFNADLVKKAGGDPEHFPTNWSDLFELGLRIEKPEDKIRGLKLDWDITGNWMWQALVFSYGGTMMTPDEKTVAFNSEAGQKAMSTIARAVTEAKMRDTTLAVTQQDFVAGRLGIWVHPSSRLGQIVKQVGTSFDVRTARFPLGGGEASRLPAGGNAVVMLTKDPAKQKAAWEYMKFLTGPIGVSIMVKATGYLPANTLPAKDPALLADFYNTNRNLQTSLSQLPVLTGWYAFPGENGLKITDVINDRLQTVVNQSAAPDAALKQMATDVQALLPK